ncbi:FAD-binding protein [Rhodovulum sp. 12E13]|uniref:FAD-dependent monooxygenase n=1 Tax=Rhodovulum sp. 12E13 TaxID=2203891 RepID=UPI000E15775A|nr:FAD-dependent monooxygenase [Rhodovulum sp. 12E13]RDC73643.1 FAD-binding protein [Rhodovulum sp. 12E13]
MARTETDVFIAGGGIAGLSAALAFGRAGFRVVLASPAPPVTEERGDGSDLRSTAFLQPAKDLYEEIGLWPALGPDAVPLEGLRIVDSAGWPPEVRDTREFRATDLGLDCFGWNLINWRVSKALMEVLAGEPSVDLRLDTRFASMVTRESGALVRLASGDSVAARLVVAADGRDSAVRQAAGIGVDVTRYGQKALAFTVTHPVPHQNVSTEIYNEGGPFTMVPLPDVEGRPASAIVWMNPGAKALDLASMEQAAFDAVMSVRSCHHLGPLTLASERRVWPIVSQRAERLVAERTAILAEAAHVVPPIGAQGLNTSLNDVIALRDLAVRDPSRLGTPDMLATFARTRGPDIRARVAAIDLFNRVTRSGEPVLQALRLAGLRTVYDVAPLRQAVMRAGMAR